MQDKNEDQIVKYRKQLVVRTFLYNFLGTTLPFVLMVIILPAASRITDISHFIKKGDFFLYSAAIWSTCLFLFQENRKSINTNWDSIAGTLSWLFIAISASIYVFLYFFQKNCNFIYILIVSIILLLLAGITLYRFIKINSSEKYPEINIQKDSHEQIESLKEQI